MGRKPRVQHYGAVYHIIQKGKFESDDDKMILLQILGEVKEAVEYYLLGYCIFDDCYHLVIKTLNIQLSNIMQRINVRYSQYYNKGYSSTGSPLSGRYKGIILRDGTPIYELINYVHNKPVYVKLVSSMDEYKWSSDFFYRINMESIVDINYLLSILSTDREKAIILYDEKMRPIKDDYNSLNKIYEYGNYIGKEKRITLDHILESICLDEKDYNLIKSGSRLGYLKPYKRKYIIKAKENGYGNAEIGRNIGIGDRSVRKYLGEN